MKTIVRAELAKQAGRPANWMLLGIAVALNLTFAYLIPYAGYLGADTTAPNADRGLTSMLPAMFPANVLGGLPIFVGALVLVFGVLASGSEYSFGSWKTLLVLEPSRTRLLAAKAVTVLVGAVTMILVLGATSALTSAVIATLADSPITWPGYAEMGRSLGAATLIATMWGAFGVFLGIAFRSVALAIGLGLVWMLAIQNLLAGVAAPLLDVVDRAQHYLPGPNAGALAAAFGANSDTPGVSAIVSTPHAVTVVTVYLIVFCSAAAVLLKRRDVL